LQSPNWVPSALHTTAPLVEHVVEPAAVAGAAGAGAAGAGAAGAGELELEPLAGESGLITALDADGLDAPVPAPVPDPAPAEDGLAELAEPYVDAVLEPEDDPLEPEDEPVEPEEEPLEPEDEPVEPVEPDDPLEPEPDDAAGAVAFDVPQLVPLGGARLAFGEVKTYLPGFGNCTSLVSIVLHWFTDWIL
jgi:hypothetical protein